MTINELVSILNNVDNKERKVCMDSYSITDVNGYYYSRKDGVDIIVLTTLHVQPLIPAENNEKPEV